MIFQSHPYRRIYNLSYYLLSPILTLIPGLKISQAFKSMKVCGELVYTIFYLSRFIIQSKGGPLRICVDLCFWIRWLALSVMVRRLLYYTNIALQVDKMVCKLLIWTLLVWKWDSNTREIVMVVKVISNSRLAFKV